jgi:hypothetical protein
VPMSLLAMTKLHSGDQGDDIGATRPGRPNRLTTWASFRGHTEGPGPAEYASNGIDPPRIGICILQSFSG